MICSRPRPPATGPTTLRARRLSLSGHRGDWSDGADTSDSAAWIEAARLYGLTMQGAGQETTTRRVLIVDDDASIRTLVRGVLALADACVVGEALNGREGIELAAQLQPDLIVLDIEMPLMQGTEAYPRIRAAAPDARVVVFSIREPGSDFPGATYVRKGSSVTELVAAFGG